MLEASPRRRARSHTLEAWLGSRLPSRIAGTHQCHSPPGAQLCLKRRSPIVHARRLEKVEAIDRELPAARPARDYTPIRPGLAL